MTKVLNNLKTILLIFLAITYIGFISKGINNGNNNKYPMVQMAISGAGY